MRIKSIRSITIIAEVIIVIGQRLKETRKNKGVTQDELAELLGVQKSTISSYESDKIDPVDKSKVMIAKRFNISLDYLLGVIDIPVPYFNDKMIILPDNIKEHQMNFINEYITFITRQSDY